MKKRSSKSLSKSKDTYSDNNINSFEQKNNPYHESDENKNLIIKNQHVIINQLKEKLFDLENHLSNLFESNETVPKEYQRIIHRINNIPPIPSKVPYIKSPIENNLVDTTHLEGFDDSEIIFDSNKENFSFIRVNSVNIFTVNVARATLEYVSEFKEFLDSLITENMNSVVDLTKCDFFDSTFVGVLVNFLKYSLKNNGDVKLVVGEETKSTLFHVTRMDKVFNVYQNVEEAILSYKSDN